MKITIPSDSLDSLMTREDFVKKVEDLVQEENTRVLGVALHNVVSVNAKAGEYILEAITKLEPLYADNPELVKLVLNDLYIASSYLAQLAQHFEIEKAMGEKIHATKH